ncbi:endolytic transglycosylase MltG [Sulfitobacter sp. 1A12157]|uniref:endolytic transglycosylase MltG n=1 Tax=Sulfitobacter sp. 1A12157 TaxID=3368594 RepID=UPI003746B30F
MNNIALIAYTTCVAVLCSTNIINAQESTEPFKVTALSCKHKGNFVFIEMANEPPVLAGAPKAIVQKSDAGFVLQYQTVWEGVPLLQNFFFERRDSQWTYITATGAQVEKESCADLSSIAVNLLGIVDEYRHQSIATLANQVTSLQAELEDVMETTRTAKEDAAKAALDKEFEALVRQQESGILIGHTAEISYQIGPSGTLAKVREWEPNTKQYVQRAKFSLLVDNYPEIYEHKLKLTDTSFELEVEKGVTSWQVTEALRAIDALSGTIEETPEEGTLAPSKYRFSNGTDRSHLVSILEKHQRERLDLAWSARTEDNPASNPQDLLVLASIIEKEARSSEDSYLISSVFSNRLSEDMRLQNDASVIYGITKGKGPLGRNITRSDLREETPWNTYIIPGLPPTPISTPSISSLAAAAQPEKTDYVFFVADDSGGHTFAATLDKHNENIIKLIEVEE